MIEVKQAPKEMWPTAPKEGIQCYPDLEKLCAMTVKELENVESFKVWNEHGSIEWVDKTDLTSVDLADIISIQRLQVEVYDDERHAATKPTVGKKLNKPAIITLNNVRPKANQSAAVKEALLKQKIEENGAEHLSYDVSKHEWMFKVAHFTQYGVCDEDDYDEMNGSAAAPGEQSESKVEASQLMPDTPVAAKGEPKAQSLAFSASISQISEH